MPPLSKALLCMRRFAKRGGPLPFCPANVACRTPKLLVASGAGALYVASLITAGLLII